LAGVSKDVIAICNSDTIAEQAVIWRQKLRPVLFNPVVVALLKSPVFCWNALGVPLNQRQMLLNEGSFFEFVRDTLDPLASTYSFKNGAYFYLLVGVVLAFTVPYCSCRFRRFWDTIPRLRVLPILLALGSTRSKLTTPKLWTLFVYIPIQSWSENISAFFLSRV
jgi:hypothetical protein